MYPCIMKELRFSASSLRFNSQGEIRQKKITPEVKLYNLFIIYEPSESHNLVHCRNEESC